MVPVNALSWCFSSQRDSVHNSPHTAASDVFSVYVSKDSYCATIFTNPQASVLLRAVPAGTGQSRFKDVLVVIFSISSLGDFGLLPFDQGRGTVASYCCFPVSFSFSEWTMVASNLFPTWTSSTVIWIGLPADSVLGSQALFTFSSSYLWAINGLGRENMFCYAITYLLSRPSLSGSLVQQASCFVSP